MATKGKQFTGCEDISQRELPTAASFFRIVPLLKILRIEKYSQRAKKNSIASPKATSGPQVTKLYKLKSNEYTIIY